MYEKYTVMLILIGVVVVCSSVETAEDFTPFLKPTKNIDSDHPLIIQKARELTQNCRTDPAKARMLYEFARDSYNNNSSGSFKASDVLIYGGNNFIRRSILLSALCRAAGIPGFIYWNFRLEIIVLRMVG